MKEAPKPTGGERKEGALTLSKESSCILIKTHFPFCKQRDPQTREACWVTSIRLRLVQGADLGAEGILPPAVRRVVAGAL